MRQIALPLAPGGADAVSRIVVGHANQAAVEGLQASHSWPFRTAILLGPPRSGKSLLGRWFVQSGAGEAVDDADKLDETALFHRWNRAQESDTPLLLTATLGPDEWRIALPDLASRLGAAMHLTIGAPDDAMLADLLAIHAELRGLALPPEAASYLVPRMERTHAGVERLVAAIDRISLERKAPPGQSIWREALESVLP